MPLRYQRRLFEHLRHDDYTPRRIGDLAAELGIAQEERPEFEAAVRSFAGDGLVEVSASGVVSLPSAAGRPVLTGVFKKTLKGFGFVEPDPPVREGSIFVPAEATGDALSGDVVRITLSRDRARERQFAGAGPQFMGEIAEVVRRKRTTFAGELARRGSQWVLHPDGREITNPIVVRDAEAKNAREGLKAVVEIVAFPEGDVLAEGVITRLLGEAGRPDVETQAVILAYNLPGEFAEECHAQAREATRVFEDDVAKWHAGGAAALEGRTDLTGEFIITIDPPDAKDYDDAISIRKTERGWDLGVHIADVARFVPPGSPIDEEAADRCNSVYLPRLVIPMIPEILSNGICSLQEGVPRFCKSAFMSYDRDGSIRGEGVGATLIRSAKRLTYLEAQALIDGDLEEARRHAKTPPAYSDQLLGTLREMDALAKAIQGRRRRRGMISLELPEVVLLFDEQGRVVDAEREDDAFTHTLIEMFMVEANEVLARLFERLAVPLLRRTHPDPVPGDVDQLRKAAMVAGYRIPRSPTREELQSLLDATRGTSASRAVHMAVLRTLSRAEYSPALIGHFALASSAYAHFTSPIRRYADLTVHRALEEYLRRTRSATERPGDDAEYAALGRKMRGSEACPAEAALTDIGRLATQRENNAEEAERSLRQFLVLQLLENRVGEAYGGVVTGVSQRGVFVQIDKFLADGFVKAEDLPGDVTRENLTPFWRIDPRTGALVDQRSGRSFNMGDTVTVKIAAVDLARRRLELVIADEVSRAGGKAKRLPPPSGIGGGLAPGGGAGFGRSGMTGSQRRSQKSKSRDKRKGNQRRDG